MRDMPDIPGYAFSRVEPVSGGWSDDAKYRVWIDDGTALLLRLSDIGRLERKRLEFDWMQRIAALDIPMSRPVDFGVCAGGTQVYMLLTWCEGEEASAALPRLSEAEQYALGIRGGQILRQIHTLPAPEGCEDWAVRFGRKMDTKIERYRACGLRFDGDEAVIAFLQRSRHLLGGRPQCCQHGDYHVGNMVVAADGTLSIIDFDRLDWGDPWEEFNRIVWSATASPSFATGQLNGYFGRRPPEAFFTLLALYIGTNLLSSIYWAIPFGKQEVETMMRQAGDVLRWYDGMRRTVPDWYQEDLCLQSLDGVSYRLKAPYDLSFVHRWGAAFTVFDDQDSGNLCIGVRDGDARRFIKFAGAPTVRGCVSQAEAVDNLKASEPLYRALAHPNLVRLLEAGPIGSGYAMVFDWADGDCIGRMYPQARARFLRLPLEHRLQVFDDILAFHAHVAACGYVAIDFYDGSVLYDARTQRTTICDIDFYAKRPYTNTMGRLWGSARFMSPEEFVLGAAIDEVTNVYTMGATAFALFADFDRTPGAWMLDAERYAVALAAVSDDRAMRPQSIGAFIRAWNTGMHRDDAITNL